MQDDMYDGVALQARTTFAPGPRRTALLFSYAFRMLFFWWLVGIVDFLLVLFLFIFPIGSSWLVFSQIEFLLNATARAQGIVSNSSSDVYVSNNATNFVCSDTITFRSASGQLLYFGSSDCADNGEMAIVYYNPQHPQDAQTSDKLYKSFVVGSIGMILGVFGLMILIPRLPAIPRRLLQAYRGIVLRL